MTTINMVHARLLLFLTVAIATTLRGQGVDSGGASGSAHVATATGRVVTSSVTTATGVRGRWQDGSDVTLINVDSILQTTPAATIADILETRVPGLIVMHSSGVPGDPSRLRLRGTSSLVQSNDPIVLLNGIRLSTDRTGDPLVNLAGVGSGSADFAAPSPLDQIDPHALATVEVLRGPSATALYGSDGANGVILLTTKRGESGAMHWNLSLDGGRSSLPGKYPTNPIRWGYGMNSSGNGICQAGDLSCKTDSITFFQALNDPRYTLFGDGGNASTALTLSGGGSRVTYALTGAASSAAGILHLPSIEASHFQQIHGFAAPDWMRDPDRYTTQSGVATVSATLWRGATAAFTSALFNGEQRRSTLERSIPLLFGAYVNQDTAVQNGFVPDYMERVTSKGERWSNALAVEWPIASWLPLSGTLGTDRVTRKDAILLPYGYSVGADSTGRMQSGDGTSTTRSATLSTVVSSGTLRHAHLSAAMGVSVIDQSDVTTTADYILTSPQSSGMSQQRIGPRTTFGAFIEPRLEVTSRLFVTPGIRWDGSHVSGAATQVTTFPRIAASWIASEEPYFRIKQLLPQLRVRMAYGYAGDEQGGDVPLYSGAPQILIFTPSLQPERSRELEGGFDTQWWDQRLSLNFTTYQKTTPNALVYVQAVGPSQPLQNGMSLRNTGTEISVAAQLLRSQPVAWTIAATFGHNDNTVTSVTPVIQSGLYLDQFGTRVAAGYPLFGRWARPITGYLDANGDGVISSSEVTVGDTAVYLGPELPRTTLGVNSSVAIFGGRLTASTTLEYQNGMSQFDVAAITTSTSGTTFLANSANAPAVSQAQQAYVAALPQTPIGVIQTVHVLRWSELSVRYAVPELVSRRFLHVLSASIALQGRNLGSSSNYRGKDPGTNTFTTANSVAGFGEVPLVRTWGVRVSLGE